MAWGPAEEDSILLDISNAKQLPPNERDWAIKNGYAVNIDGALTLTQAGWTRLRGQ